MFIGSFCSLRRGMSLIMSTRQRIRHQDRYANIEISHQHLSTDSPQLPTWCSARICCGVTSGWVASRAMFGDLSRAPLQRDRKYGAVTSYEDQLKGEGTGPVVLRACMRFADVGIIEAGMHDLTEFENLYHRFVPRTSFFESWRILSPDTFYRTHDGCFAMTSQGLTWTNVSRSYHSHDHNGGRSAEHGIPESTDTASARPFIHDGRPIVTSSHTSSTSECPPGRAAIQLWKKFLSYSFHFVPF